VRPYITALEAYKSGDYGVAVEGFTAVARSGVRSGKLYYNLGNACLKNNQLGQAILWYERALKLMPHDPDLRFNYEFARSLTKDASVEGTPLVRIFFFWKYQLSPTVIVWMAIGLTLLFWLALIAHRIFRRRVLRRLSWSTLIPALIFILTAGVNFYETSYRPQAIILPEQSAVRSGLQNDSTELFTLHAGARVRVLKTRSDHYQIRFSEDKIGWVPKADIGLIP
jgi:hypothetical protein